MSNSASARKSGNDQLFAGRSFAEWITAAIAFTIVLLVAGLVVYDWITTPALPPTISIRQAGEIRAANNQFYVPFEVENSGGTTAESVQVRAELAIDGQVVEDGEQTIDFLAGAETQNGAFVFRRDPAQGELTLRIASYQEP